MAENSAAGTILNIEGLNVSYPVYETDPVRALRGIDLKVREGEIIGLVGESGSGKTTLARSIMQLISRPGRVDSGRIEYDGRDLATLGEEELRALRGNDIAMVIPNPRTELNPLVTVGMQIANVARYHLSLPRKEAKKMAMAMLEAVQIPDPTRRFKAYPHELSGGMAQRVVMAIALICSPRFIISDDATSGLDVTVQTQVLELLQDLVQQQGASMLFITRDIGITAHYCHQVAIIYAGEIVELASTQNFFDNPQHPYSVMLLSAFSHNPKLRGLWTKVADAALEGAAESGCYFAARCVRASDKCRAEHPDMREMTDAHSVRCHHPVER
ncbi:MAG: ABC transporter ATP-binding protein [Rhodospirillaceae bacterium]|nr:ABC transporter ATP-binding protein [Rhodospirillaceae bacterium]